MSTSVAAALASAACFGAASAGQYAAVGDTAARSGLDLRLLGDLARRPLWWLAGALEAAAVVLQVVALAGASVALVQSLLVLGLPIAVVLSGRLTPRTVAAVALTTSGLWLFAANQSAHESAAPTTSTASWAVPLGVALAAALLARHARPVLLGLAAGVVTGCATVLLAATTSFPWHEVLVHPAAYAAAVVGVLALQVGQAALRAPRIGPPLAALTVAEPLTAVTLAAVVLHQSPHLSPPEVLGAALAVLGVLVLQAAATREHSSPSA